MGASGDAWLARRQAWACEAAYLRYMTAVVEITKLPTELQEERLRALPAPTQPLPAFLEALAGHIDWVKRAERFHLTRAVLRCATAGLAAERYRLNEQRWPNDLAALVPRFLEAVPNDPFDGRPLRLRRLQDGLVIYSVGPDRVDDGGKLDGQTPDARGTDVGFQLWDTRDE